MRAVSEQMRVRVRILFAAALVALLQGSAAGAGDHLRLATTTSMESSGLLSVVLPPFEKRSGITVDVIAVGSGAALALAANGDVDVVLSHAPELEERFVAAGHGVNRREVMYNDFVLLGPAADPAGVGGSADAAAALAKIAAVRAPFVSRGDRSGTHEKEKALWRAAGIKPSGEWYRVAGQGMGPVLLMASEMAAYTLADRATYLVMKAKIEMKLLLEGDSRLRNPYAIIAVNPARHRHVRYPEAMALIAWFSSPEGQELIGNFKSEGAPLFVPLAIEP